jgi:hypothetical protein
MVVVGRGLGVSGRGRDRRFVNGNYTFTVEVPLWWRMIVHIGTKYRYGL